jgi:predicted  nucleic acid-binding Zn-ribbon protein
LKKVFPMIPGVTSARRFGILCRNTKGVIDMLAKSIICATFAGALFVAGCGPSKEEIAKQNAHVSELRKILASSTTATEELILLKGENAEGVSKLKANVERAKSLLAQPADVKQIPALENAVKEFEGASKALQDEVDRQTDEVRRANEAVRKAAESIK